MVYCLQVGAKILDAGDIVPCLAARNFGEFFSAFGGSIGQGDVGVRRVEDVVVAGGITRECAWSEDTSTAEGRPSGAENLRFGTPKYTH